MMERELFFSGYCRSIDGSRMVEAVIADGKLEEADCRYPDCLYAPNCPIAGKIEEELQ